MGIMISLGKWGGVRDYQKYKELWKWAFSDILKVCEKYSDIEDEFSRDEIGDIANKAKNRLLLVEWYEKYGIALHPTTTLYGSTYIGISDYMSFQLFKDANKCRKEGDGRYILISDDGRQPEDGWYFVIDFPSGAYIFGDDYDGQQLLSMS